MITVLVVGGAGYIGSHMVWLLGHKGVKVIVLDNLSSGHRDAVLCGEFICGDLSDKILLKTIFSAQKIDAVMHFASYIQVGESNRDPAKYYENNVTNTLNLLNAMIENGVDKIIFSSTAAIFGNPVYVPIDEAHPKNPINPYGRTKLVIEHALADYDTAYGLKSVCLRYFNAAGAHPNGQLSERHEPETHLIPLVLSAARKNTSISVFGDDYETPDGTCIRDYIHVMDLVDAHWLSLLHLLDNGPSLAFNLGNGSGSSVNEIISSAEKITNSKINKSIVKRREGDPAVLISDSRKIKNELGWQTTYSDIEQIIGHALISLKKDNTSS